MEKKNAGSHLLACGGAAIMEALTYYSLNRLTASFWV